MISLILAIDDKGGIGKNNSLPWPHNKEDMEFFKNITNQKTILMGKNTWKSLPKKPLPNRLHYIFTTDLMFPTSHVIKRVTTDDVSGWITKYDSLHPDEELMIIGGVSLVEQSKSIIDKIYLTKIHGDFDCDVFLDLTLLSNFVKIYNNTTDECTFNIYKRIDRNMI